MVRDMPHMARASLVSSRMATSMLALVELGNDVVDEHVLELALGALHLATSWPFTVAVTPPGTVTGFLPMRDMINLRYQSSA